MKITEIGFGTVGARSVITSVFIQFYLQVIVELYEDCCPQIAINALDLLNACLTRFLNRLTESKHFHN
jgi:hypothetical protein